MMADDEGENAFQVDNPDNEEEISLKNNCSHFKEFLEALKVRGEEGLSHPALNEVHAMESKMIEYLIKKKRIKKQDIKEEEKDSDGDDDSSVTTAKEKKNMQRKVKALKVKQQIKDSSETSSFLSSSNSSEESSGETSKVRKRRQRKPKEEVKGEEPEILAVLQKFDNRAVPKQEKFNEDSGQDLEQYLERFEEYCVDNFRGRTYLWIAELERQLQGKILDGFKSLRDYNDSYDEVKEKLIKWHNDSKHLRRSKAKKRFEQARMKPKESLFLFGTRLETLFKTAFPTHRVAESKTLRQQFLNNIPKSIRTEINSQIMTCKLKDKKVTWPFVMKCARLKDTEWENQRKEESNDEEKPEEILINLSNMKTLNMRQQYQQRPQNNFENRKFHGDKSVRQFQGFSNPPEREWCNICKRFGHSFAKCRRQLKACFICGASDHFIRDCQHSKWNRGQGNYNKLNEKNVDRQRYQGQQVRQPKFSNQRFNSASPVKTRDKYQGRHRNFSQQRQNYYDNQPTTSKIKQTPTYKQDKPNGPSTSRLN